MLALGAYSDPEMLFLREPRSFSGAEFPFPLPCIRVVRHGKDLLRRTTTCFAKRSRLIESVSRSAVRPVVRQRVANANRNIVYHNI